MFVEIYILVLYTIGIFILGYSLAILMASSAAQEERERHYLAMRRICQQLEVLRDRQKRMRPDEPAVLPYRDLAAELEEMSAALDEKP